jgi:hypothetical protein
VLMRVSAILLTAAAFQEFPQILMTDSDNWSGMSGLRRF